MEEEFLSDDKQADRPDNYTFDSRLSLMFHLPFILPLLVLSAVRDYCINLGYVPVALASVSYPEIPCTEWYMSPHYYYVSQIFGNRWGCSRFRGQEAFLRRAR